MKQIIFTILTFLLFSKTYSQNWKNYTASTNIWGISVKGDTIFAASDGGFIKTTPSIDSARVYTKANSNLAGETNNIRFVYQFPSGKIVLSVFNGTYFYQNGQVIPDTLPPFFHAVIDGEGDAWLAGDGNLMVYDGNAIIEYTTSNSPLFGQVYDLAINPTGDSIWLAVGSTLQLVENGNWTTFDNSDSPFGTEYTDRVEVDTAGRVWSIVSQDLFPDDPETNIIADILYVGKATSWTPIDTNHYDQFLADPDGSMWAATNTGLLHYTDLMTKQLYEPQILDSPTDFTVISMTFYNGGILLGTVNDGILFFKNGVFTEVPSSNSGLRSNLIEETLIDDQGNKWIATFGGGLVKYDGAAWEVYNPSNSALGDDEITDLELAANGTLWIGTVNNGLGELSNGTLIQHSMQAPSVRALELDNAGNVWIGFNNGGIGKFDGDTLIRYSVAPFPHLEDVWDLAFDNAGDLWIAVYQSGLYKFDGTTFTNVSSGLPTNLLRTIDVDPAGDVWVGSENAGVFVYDGTMWTTIDMANSPLPSNYVNDFTFENGAVWIATGAGAARLENGTWTVYSLDNSKLPGGLVTDISRDLNNDLWISTLSGIGVLTDEIITSFFSGKTDFPVTSPSVFPNPANAAFKVINPDGYKNSHLKILSISGQIKYSGQIPEYDLIIDASSWEEGAYIYNITSDKGIVTGKVFIVK